MMLLRGRRSKGTGDSPTMESSIHGLVGYFQFIGPLRYRFSLTIKFYKDIMASIVTLVFSRFPHAIIRRIRIIIIFSFNLKSSLKSWIHVRDKVMDIVPSVTNGNAPSAVMLIGWIFGIFTSLHHRGPDPIERMLRHIMRCQGFLSKLRNLFNMKTTTRLCVPSKCITSDIFFSTTIAKANETRITMTRIILCPFQNKQAAKPLSSQVNEHVPSIYVLA